MNRIFPTQPASADAFGTPHEFVGIDINKVAASLRSPESSKQNVLAKELKEQLVKLARHDDDEYSYDEPETRVAQKITKQTRTASKTSPIIFTHISQVSADALRAAEDSGNERLANAIKGAREEIRSKMATTIDKNERLAEAELGKRKAARAKTVKVAEARAETVKTASVSTNSFKPTTKLSGAEKDAFVKKAQSMGFSDEYIMAVVTPNDDDSKVEEIKSVMASNLADSTKRTVLSGMMKEADLNDEQLARLKTYWNDELQYGDKQYVNDWFTKLSNGGSESKEADYEGADSKLGKTDTSGNAKYEGADSKKGE
jgi:hypothetical protein